MIKRYLLVGVTAACLLLSGCGCGNKVVAVEEETIKETYIKLNDIAFKDDRFFIIYYGNNSSPCLVVDADTKVQYIYVRCGYGGGMTVLLDSDGKPLLYEGEIK